MRPGEILGELGEKGRCHGGTAFPSTDIREIGEVALERFGVVFGERQAPRAVIGAGAGRKQLRRKPVIRRHDAAQVGSKRDYTCAGQSRDIYPWHTPEDVVMEAASRMRSHGWYVERLPYRGSTGNYSGGHYYLRVTAPSVKARIDGWLCRLLGWATRSFCSC